MSMSDIKKIKPGQVYLGATFLGAILLVVGFQNCTGFETTGEGSFNPLQSGLFPIEALANSDGLVPEDRFIYSLYPREQLAVGMPLEFWGYQREFEAGVVEVYWDHEIWVDNPQEDRRELQYCAELESPSDWAYVIECDKPGELYLTLIVAYSSGREDIVRAKAEIWSEAAPGPNPLDPNMPVEPTPLDGVALYNLHCAGCHGPHATTSKPNRSSTQITNAINNNVGGMGFLSSLTPAEVDAIATGLRR